ncbi:fimbrial biogenesis chaperone [Serratia quinivorans]|uniref:fimbrial biogenesis chaperone n=1 Tax=Serratia quinivorans TaxID=137545 RepID=UPI0028DC2CD0|nr:hypothetical protein [Serratia quinivorans]
MGNAPVITTNVMVPPKSSVAYPMPSAASGQVVSWQVINDFGGNSKTITSPLN